jgi:hypothetical protein
MTIPRKTHWITRIGAIAVIAGFAFVAVVLRPSPAEARVFVGFGFGFPIGFPGFYYPPYPYYLPPPPAYSYPPPAYYPPAGYPPAGDYSAPGSYRPSGSAAPVITYTPRRGWTNAQGEYCREYRSTQGNGSRATERYGTACRDPSGQWRIVN